MVDVPKPNVVDPMELPDDEKVRLLFCATCQTVDELPYYEGPPEHDVLLEYLLAEKHTFPSGLRHVSPFNGVAVVSKKEWEQHRDAIIAKAMEVIREGGSPGLGAEFYNARNTFAEDAMACWRRRHNRTENCDEYQSDKKLLLPPTKELRKEAGLAPRPAYMRRYLCDFCPYHQIVVQRKRAAQGYYDYK
mgnify:FL=1